MDTEFYDLHRDIEVAPTEEQLEKRWEAVEELVSKISAVSIVDMVRLAHRRSPLPETEEAFWGPFKERDSTFPIRDAELLHGTLAVGCIRQLMRSDDGDVQLMDLTALMVRLAEHLGWDAIRPDMLRGPVQSYLDRREPRESADPPAPSRIPGVWSKTVAENVRTNATAGSWDNVYAAFEALGTAAEASIRALSKSYSAMLAWQVREVARLTEQQSIASWLLEAALPDGKPWRDVGEAQLGVELGLDLADRLTRIPGPPDGERLLIEAVTLGREVAETKAKSTIDKAAIEVNASPKEVPDVLLEMVPIHSAIGGRRIAAEVASRKWTSGELARLAYSEALVLRAWRGAGDTTE